MKLSAGAHGPTRLPTPWLFAVLFLIFNLVLLTAFADRAGYEGDDINSVVPMAHLDAAKAGLLLIYRYAWQPLSYEIGSIVWTLFGTPTAVFLLAPVCGAVALSLLFWWLAREGGSRSTALRMGIALIALLGAPELWFSALYYNSTILGMPLLVGALLLVRLRDDIPAVLAAGVLAGLAIMMRLDFVLVCPLLAVAAWRKGTSIARPIALAAAVCATLLAGFLAGLLDPQAIIDIQTTSTAEIRDKANMPGWNLYTKLTVATVALSPAGWAMLLGGIPLLLVQSARRRDWRALLWIGAAIPACYPLISILSPKYILPMAPFLLLFFLRALEAALDCLHGRWAGWALTAMAALAFLPIFLSVSLLGHAPFLAPGLAPVRPLLTHDGPRGYGGYVWLMRETSAYPEMVAQRREATAYLDELKAGPVQTMVILGGENVFDRGGIGWRHLQLMLEREGIHGTLQDAHRLDFDLGGRRLILAREMPRLTSTDQVKVVDLRERPEADS